MPKQTIDLSNDLHNSDGSLTFFSNDCELMFIHSEKNDEVTLKVFDKQLKDMTTIMNISIDRETLIGFISGL